MADVVKMSLGLRNHVLSFGSLKSGLQGGVLYIFDGVPPVSADLAQTGKLLAVMTELGAAWTPETISHGSITLTSGSSGQVTQVSINGLDLLTAPVSYNTSLFQTASDVAAAINRNVTSPRYQARAADRTVYLFAMPGTGMLPNGYVVAITTISISTNIINMSDGVNAVNGIKFAYAAAGVLSKISSQVVRGTVLFPGGNAGYWRMYTEAGDTGGADTKGRWRRAQGVVGLPGESDDPTLVVPSVAFVTDSVQKVETFQVRL